MALVHGVGALLAGGDAYELKVPFALAGRRACLVTDRRNLRRAVKVDRLTRLLADFGKLVELFDQHSVSFVPVTQSFNTTSSMGRLTLNVPRRRSSANPGQRTVEKMI
jgi:hypothetical protein